MLKKKDKFSNLQIGYNQRVKFLYNKINFISKYKLFRILYYVQLQLNYNSCSIHNELYK